MSSKVRVKKTPEVARLEERLAEAEGRAVSARARAVQDRLRAALAARRRLAQYYSMATVVGEVVVSAIQLSREVGPELSDAQVRVLSMPQRLSRSYWGAYLLVRDAYSLSLDELKHAVELLRAEVCCQDRVPLASSGGCCRRSRSSGVSRPRPPRGARFARTSGQCARRGRSGTRSRDTRSPRYRGDEFIPAEV